MKSMSVVLLCLCFWGTVAIVPLPPFIKQCSVKDPNVDDCALKHAREAIPHLIPGHPQYHLPTLDPFHMDEIKLLDKGPKQARLKLTIKDADVHGVKEINVQKLHFSFPKNAFEPTLHCTFPRLELISKYDVVGQILVLPITGKGNANLTIINLKARFKPHFDIYQKEGRRFMKMTDMESELDADKLYVKLTNLFGGNKLLGDEMNYFLNENWRAVYNETLPTIIGAFKNIIFPISNGITDNIPYDMIFADTE